MTTQNLINEFLEQKRFAMIGVSRNPKDFSRSLFREFMKRGYDVVPVNPHASDIEGIKPPSNIREVTAPVTAALLLVSPLFMQQVVQDCADAGVTLLWIYGITGSSSVDSRILKFCEDHGMRVIAGQCPFMFFHNSALLHRFHGWAWKMIGYYPK